MAINGDQWRRQREGGSCVLAEYCRPKNYSSSSAQVSPPPPLNKGTVRGYHRDGRRGCSVVVQDIEVRDIASKTPGERPNRGGGGGGGRRDVPFVSRLRGGVADTRSIEPSSMVVLKAATTAARDGDVDRSNGLSLPVAMTAAVMANLTFESFVACCKSKRKQPRPGGTGF